MQIEGTVRANLIAAIASARRWNGRPVHDDTLGHWRELIDHARRAGLGGEGESLAGLVAELEAQLAARTSAPREPG